MQKKTKKGISLIVLVITIIVMIILAAAIILSLNNAGIIGNANKAVEMTNENTIQTAADLKYSEYILNNSLAGSTPVGEWIKAELIADNILTTETAKQYKITDKGQVIKLDYYDETTYNMYVKKLGFEVLDLGYDVGTSLSGIHVFRNKIEEVDEYIESLRGKKVALPYGIISINNCNFENTSGEEIESIEDFFVDPIRPIELYIPNTVTNISKQAIGSTTITDVYLPDSIEFFGDDTSTAIFKNCTNLTQIHYSGNIMEGAPWGANNANIMK